MSSNYVPPLGIRQNNPGNVRASKIDWLGEVSSKNGFEAMSSPLDGVRMLMINSLTKYFKYGLKSLETIIPVLTPDKSVCPEDGNDTPAYIDFMCKFCGVLPGEDLLLAQTDKLIKFAQGITLREQGYPPKNSVWPLYWYDESIYQRAAELALIPFAKYQSKNPA